MLSKSRGKQAGGISVEIVLTFIVLALDDHLALVMISAWMVIVY